MTAQRVTTKNKKYFVKEYVSLLVEQMLQSETPANDIQVFLDMDGVLANFDKAILHSKGYSEAKTTLNNVLKGMPDLAKLSEDELKVRLAGPQTDPGLKALKKAFNDYRAVKYEIAGQDGFFLNLEPMPGADILIKGVSELTGKLPIILTAPGSQNSEQNEKEKHEWMNKHFPGKFSQFYCTQNKAAFAKGNPSNVLIDDREKYTGPFENAGGTAILYKGNTKQALEQVSKMMVTTVPQETEVVAETNIKVNNNKNIQYTALVLSKADHNRLLKAFPAPEGWDRIAHHVTINMGSYGGNRELVGRSFPIKVVSYASNDLVAAAGVQMPNSINTKNANPHITIAVNRLGGGKPVMSNQLNWNEAKTNGPTFIVEGTLIEVESGNGNKFSDEY